SSADACAGNSRTGAHQRRIASPSGESNIVMKSGTGSVEPSLIDASKPALSMGLLNAPCTWWSISWIPRRWSASAFGTRSSTPAKTSPTSPTGIARNLLCVDLPCGRVRDGLAENGRRPARLLLGQHQRRGDLQDVAADVEDDRT